MQAGDTVYEAIQWKEGAYREPIAWSTWTYQIVEIKGDWATIQDDRYNKKDVRLKNLKKAH